MSQVFIWKSHDKCYSCTGFLEKLTNICWQEILGSSFHMKQCKIHIFIFRHTSKVFDGSSIWSSIIIWKILFRQDGHRNILVHCLHVTMHKYNFTILATTIPVNLFVKVVYEIQDGTLYIFASQINKKCKCMCATYSNIERETKKFRIHK